MSFSYYIYYRVAQPAQAQTLVQHIQAALKDKTGIDGRLLRKRDDPSSWMEIYESVRDPLAFETVLSELLPVSGLVALLEPGAARHTERFVPGVS